MSDKEPRQRTLSQIMADLHRCMNLDNEIGEAWRDVARAAAEVEHHDPVV